MIRHRSVGRLFVVLIALTGAVRHADAGVGTITISPTSGPPGTIVAVTISGFSPSPPSGGSGAGDLYPWYILLDGTNLVFPGYTDILGYSHNPPQPFTYNITIPTNWPPNPTVPGSTHTIDYQHLGSDTSTPAIFTVTGPASNVVFIGGAAQTLITGSNSSSITVQLRDSFGTPVRGAAGGTTLSLSTTSSGGSFRNASNQTVTSVVVPSTANSASFFYRDTNTGMPTLTVGGPNLTSATTVFTITPPAATVPLPPSKITATAVTSASIHVSWSPSLGATGYYVYMAQSANGTFTSLNSNPITSPFMHTGLLPNKEYFYKVKATNVAGTSATFSPVDSAVTPSPVLAGNTTVLDNASCTSMGGILGDPGAGFIGGTCAVRSLTIKEGVTLTVQGLTLVNRGTIANSGTITNGVTNAAPGSGQGGIIFNAGGSTLSNGGALTNNYGSTLLQSGVLNQWCGSAFTNIGAISPNTMVDACPGSRIFSAATPSQQVEFMASPGTFSSLTAIPESSLPLAGKPTGLSFPYGFFGWTVRGVAPGATVTVRMKFPSSIPANSPYWQVVNGTWTNLTQLVDDNNGDNILTLTIKDNGLEDADSIAGQVSDPGGFGVTSPPLTISSTTVVVIVSILLLLITNLVTYYVSQRDRPRPQRAST